jgi:hypothetical protein
MRSGKVSSSLAVLCSAVAGAASLWVLVIWWFMPRSVSPLLYALVPPIYLKLLGTAALIGLGIYFTNQPEKIAKRFPARSTSALAMRIRPITVALEMFSIAMFLWLILPRFRSVASSPNETATLSTLILLIAGTAGKILRRGMPVPSRGARQKLRQIQNEVSIDEVLSCTVPPVFYLRSFEKELRGTNLSEVFSYATTMNPFGFYMFPHEPYRPSMSGLRLSSLGTGRSLLDEQMIFGEFFRRYAPYVTAARSGEFPRT